MSHFAEIELKLKTKPMTQSLLVTSLNSFHLARNPPPQQQQQSQYLVILFSEKKKNLVSLELMAATEAATEAAAAAAVAITEIALSMMKYRSPYHSLALWLAHAACQPVS